MDSSESEGQVSAKRSSARLQTKPKVAREYYQDYQDKEWSARAARRKAKKSDGFVVEKETLKKYYEDDDWSDKSANLGEKKAKQEKEKEKKV